MTTPRTRKTPRERAEAIWRKELARLEARAAKSKAVWQDHEAAVEGVRQQLAGLGIVTPPDLEEIPGFPKKITSIVLNGEKFLPSPNGDDLTHPNGDPPAAEGTTTPPAITTTLNSQALCPTCGGTRPWHSKDCVMVEKKVKP